LRKNVFNDLINRGFKKFPMSEVTLGKAFAPQFNKFLTEVDLSLNPLERMINGLGFELHLVPIKSNDNETKRLLDNIYSNFVEISKNDLIDHIENRPTNIRVNGNNGKISKMFNEALEDILLNLD
jgi:hypothetical protein